MPKNPSRRACDAAAQQVLQCDTKPAHIENCQTAQASSWRDVLPVHPAADLFPPMSPDELRELGEDIKAHGLNNPIVLWRAPDRTHYLLDGRNRLDAIGATEVGIPDPDHPCSQVVVLGADNTDPYAFVISANIRRRHLSPEQRRNIIATFIGKAPQKSDRQFARELGVDHHTIARARTEGEDVGKVPHVETHTDTKGRQQPAKRRQRMHCCWQCGKRDTEDTVRLHSYAAYEDSEVWLHDACVNAFEESATKAPAPDRDDIGPDSQGEVARLKARLGEQDSTIRRQDITIASLTAIIEITDPRKVLTEAWQKAPTEQREQFLKEIGAQIIEAVPPAATDDLADIPVFLDRRTPKH